MEFSFDIRGYLKPYGRNKTDLNLLQSLFVAKKADSETRGKLYEGYLRYNEDLKNLLSGKKYSQWVDGSFISNKLNPRDIDLVNLLDHRLVEEYEEGLKSFIMGIGKETYGVDGYVIVIYPEAHPKCIRTRSDLVYWEHWFGKSRKERRKQRCPKGFLELAF